MSEHHPVIIAPSLLSADFAQLKDQVQLAEQGGADWIHLDVMDGHFVPNLTFGPLVIESIRKHTRLPFDTHLMMTNPGQFIDDFRSAGADIITVHFETCPHLHRTIQHIRETGAKAGVSINPSTPVLALNDIISDVDLVLVMSVNPGFGGQSFIENSLAKLRDVRRLVKSSGHQIHVEVDGGIDADTAGRVVEAGADVLVSGYFVFGSTAGELSKRTSCSQPSPKSYSYSALGCRALSTSVTPCSQPVPISSSSSSEGGPKRRLCPVSGSVTQNMCRWLSCQPMAS